MGQIVVRKIDDGLLDRLRMVAKDRNLPLEAFARNVLEEAAQRRTAAETREWLKKLDEVRDMTLVKGLDSVPLIRKLREGDETDD
ncbi:MAG: hypothetical protein FD175_1249 [Beijerinckiaceae bacterium]|nr:MAG: hypothetical protein FD175_1249 [Beijerinckiaceae bacterium]